VAAWRRPAAGGGGAPQLPRTAQAACRASAGSCDLQLFAGQLAAPALDSPSPAERAVQFGTLVGSLIVLHSVLSVYDGLGYWDATDTEPPRARDKTRARDLQSDRDRHPPLAAQSERG
jgi:hypothetical protein